MDICRLKPDHNICCSCIDIQLDTHKKKDCLLCPEYSWVRLLHLGRTIFGKDYAYVTGPITNWTIVRVETARLGTCTYTDDERVELELYCRHNNLLKAAKERKKESK